MVTPVSRLTYDFIPGVLKLLSRVSAGPQIMLPFAPAPAVAGLQRACNLGKISDLTKQLPYKIIHQRAGALDVRLPDRGVGVASVVAYIFQSVERFIVWPQRVLESLNPVSQLDRPRFSASRAEPGYLHIIQQHFQRDAHGV